MRALFAVGLNLAAALTVSHPLTADAGDDIPRVKMPESMYNILWEGMESLPVPEVTKDRRLERNGEALNHLLEVAWPDLHKLERVHLHDTKDPTRFFNAWRLPAGGDELVLLMPDFTVQRKQKSSFSKVEVFSYADELRAIVGVIRERKSGKETSWKSAVFSDYYGGGPPHRAGIYHACAAAFLGMGEEATELVHSGLTPFDGFPFIYDQWAWQGFYRGVKLLEDGASRSEVLVQWEESLKVYPHSQYRDQLIDYTATLKEQIEADKKLAAANVEDPQDLPINERIAYFIARFSDVHGQQLSQPGHCMTVGFGPPRTDSGTWLSDSVVEIGRPAVPALIEHLTDQRLTRSVGFHRNFDSHRTVLRVQDVAQQCIEKILDMYFNRPFGRKEYFSLETPEVRDKGVADIKAWWDKNGRKPPLDSQLANLERDSLSDRIGALWKIEKIDPKAVDSVALLKRWATTASGRELAILAGQLAQRGDLSLLPAIRETARKPNENVPEESVWFLLERGGAEDYTFLRQAARKDLQAGATLGTSRIFGAVAGGVQVGKNPLAAPILIDFLDQRAISGARSNVGYSCADKCIEALIRLTEHNEGYVWNDPAENRNAAIDRWIAWWREEGKAAFLEKHPDVLKVLADDADSRS